MNHRARDRGELKEGTRETVIYREDCTIQCETLSSRIGCIRIRIRATAESARIAVPSQCLAGCITVRETNSVEGSTNVEAGTGGRGFPEDRSGRSEQCIFIDHKTQDPR